MSTLYLFLIFALVLAGLIVLTTRFRFPIFLVMFFATFAFGLLAGLDPVVVVSKSLEGFKQMMGGLAVLIVSGFLLGELLEKSGGTVAIANAALRLLGKKRAPWAMALTGAVISVPVMCCDTAFIILSPISRALARGGRLPLALISLALATGTYSAFKLIPPAPGPLGVMSFFGANFAKTFFLSLLVFCPVFLVGMFWSLKAGKAVQDQFPAEEGAPFQEENELKPKTTVWMALLPIISPLFLIIIHSLAPSIFPDTPILQSWALFLGNPAVALPLGVVMQMAFNRKSGMDNLNQWFSQAVNRAASILLIVGAGGALGAVVQETGLANTLGEFLIKSQIPGLLVPFLLAALFKITQGSSLVAMLTTPALIASFLPALHLSPEIAALAVGAGALAVVHINDSFFWVVTRFAEMDVRRGFRTLTLLSLWQSLVAISVVWILGLFF